MFFRGKWESKHADASSYSSEDESQLSELSRSSSYTTTTSETSLMSDDEDRNAMEFDSIPDDQGVFLAPVVNIMFDYYGLTRLDAKDNPKVTVNTIFNAVEEHRHGLLPILLQHVVRGEQAEAQAMLDNNPELLFETGRATDYSGRVIEGTALQMALGADDAEMCEMIVSYLDKLDPEEKNRQYQRQFPDDEKFNLSVKAEHDADMRALEAVIKAINDSKEDKDCEAAIIQFRHYLEEKISRAIRTGKHVNIELLLKACELFVKNLVELDDWDSRKNHLIWAQVIGYIQRFMPACIAQAFSQGIVNRLGDQVLHRNFRFSHGSTSEHYYPLNLNGERRLGFDGAVAFGGSMMESANLFEKLDRIKSIRSYVERQQARCVNACKSENKVKPTKSMGWCTIS